MAAPPLSTPLSQLLIAFTIEFDNELDHRLAAADLGHRLPISMVMWSNFLRFVEDGITVGELPEATGIPKSRTLSTLGGMERWRYVLVGPDSESKRDGWGSERGLRREWLVRPTPIGGKTQEIAPPLFGEIEKRWEKRFGAGAIDELRQALGAVIEGLDLELPEYLPIVGSANGMRAEIEHRERGATAACSPVRLLAQVLLAYTLDFERRSELSLPLTANFVRVLGDDGSRRPGDACDRGRVARGDEHGAEVPGEDRLRHGRGKLVRLTPKGLEAQAAAPGLHADVERAWKARRLRTGA